MNHITAFTPDRDIDWMERITPALIANVSEMYAALENIATSSVCGFEQQDEAHAALRAFRNTARDALNTVFAWRAPVEITEQEIF